jgi:hypothetical protein
MSPLTDMDWTEYDKGVQVVLDQYWPNTTELTAIKRMEMPVKSVYSAKYNGEEVIVKSVDYTAELQQTTEDYGLFLNYIGEEISVASYIAPSI